MSGHWEPEEPMHRCARPEDAEIRAAGKRVGDIWVCDGCGRKWSVRYMDGGMREPDVHHFYTVKVF